jgi:hypothetical protein
LTEQEPSQDILARAADHLAQALGALQQSQQPALAAEVQKELAASRQALEALLQRFESQIADEREQRSMLAGQLTNLAGALDRLVGHLLGLSQIMTNLLERISEPEQPAEVEQPAEAAFMPGGEGVTLVLAAVPGFQALMDIQKALTALEQVAGASVERFQEGDSRILVHLREPLTAGDLVAALLHSTSYTVVVEEALPELSRLRLKVLPRE